MIILVQRREELDGNLLTNLLLYNVNNVCKLHLRELINLQAKLFSVKLKNMTSGFSIHTKYNLRASRMFTF